MDDGDWDLVGDVAGGLADAGPLGIGILLVCLIVFALWWIA